MGMVVNLVSRVRRRRPSNEICPRSLAIMAEGPARAELEAVFHEAGWELAIGGVAPIVFYERESNPSGWHAAVCALSALSPRPYIVLLSKTADGNLWEELVSCGGSDVLRMPLERDAVLRAVKTGWSIWSSQERLRRERGLARGRGRPPS